MAKETAKQKRERLAAEAAAQGGGEGGTPSGDLSQAPHLDRLPESGDKHPPLVPLTSVQQSAAARTQGAIDQPDPPARGKRARGSDFEVATKENPVDVRCVQKTYYADKMHEPGEVIRNYVGTIGRTLEKLNPKEAARMRRADVARESDDDDDE